MADEPLVFDPNHYETLYEYWMERIGNAHINEKYNGWIFLNSDREVLDVALADVEDYWVDDETREYAMQGGEEAYEIVAHWAKEVGATDIMLVHAHKSDAPLGPCPSLAGFVAQTAIHMKDLGLTFRAAYVIHGEDLDGVMWAHEGPPKGDVLQHLLADPQALAPLLGTDSLTQLILQEAKSIREAMLADPDADPRLLATVDEIIDAYETGRLPDTDMMLDAIDIIRKRNDAADLPPLPPDILRDLEARNIKNATIDNPLGLPMFIPPSGDRLN